MALLSQLYHLQIMIAHIPNQLFSLLTFNRKVFLNSFELHLQHLLLHIKLRRNIIEFHNHLISLLYHYLDLSQSTLILRLRRTACCIYSFLPRLQLQSLLINEIFELHILNTDLFRLAPYRCKLFNLDLIRVSVQLPVGYLPQSIYFKMYLFLYY